MASYDLEKAVILRRPRSRTPFLAPHSSLIDYAYKNASDTWLCTPFIYSLLTNFLYVIYT